MKVFIAWARAGTFAVDPPANQGMYVRKTIWTCWFQGRAQAPDLVRKCLSSWEERNPDWDFRCLDSTTISRYIDLDARVDLASQTITAASLSDIVRLSLLHEYGGVWVDATTFCNVPLDDWLPSAAQTGFFAFAKPGAARPLSSWFLYADPDNELVAKWLVRSLQYWRERTRSEDYFWVHHLFGDLCATDERVARAWHAVPEILADGPHALQKIGLYEDFDAVKSRIDWTTAVFKLTYRLDREKLHANCLVSRLLGLGEGEAAFAEASERELGEAGPVGQIRVGTENLGDHVQILASEALLRRAGLEPSFLVDRDDEIAHPPPPEGGDAPGLVLNGWFKTNPEEWPPHPAYNPIYIGFHVRLFQAPTLVSPAALAHYRAHGPVGCRDRYTLGLLRSYGIDAFLSHCLSITFPRRLPDPDRQTKIFVVSRDRQILDCLPPSLGEYTYLSQYSQGADFHENKARAAALLETYRNEAKLIVTSMLHCALPALAMGIPVVVFYPANEGKQHDSDRERFSSLAELMRVFRFSEASLVDWQGYLADLGHLKLDLIDKFFLLANRWGKLVSPTVRGIAPAESLPVPGASDMSAFAEASFRQ